MNAPPRESIAYHEAGHAVVGHAQGLRFSRIYLGAVGGQVIFDDQWSEGAVVADPDLLDRCALMLLAGAAAEWRHARTVPGAIGDVAALCWLLAGARRRGTVPRPARWRRAEAEVARHWPAIEAVVEELEHRSRPLRATATELAQYPHLGSVVAEVTGARVRRMLAPGTRARGDLAERSVIPKPPTRPSGRGIG